MTFASACQADSRRTRQRLWISSAIITLTLDVSGVESAIQAMATAVTPTVAANKNNKNKNGGREEERPRTCTSNCHPLTPDNSTAVGGLALASGIAITTGVCGVGASGTACAGAGVGVSAIGDRRVGDYRGTSRDNSDAGAGTARALALDAYDAC